jgi:hypothetical protein
MSSSGLVRMLLDGFQTEIDRAWSEARHARGTSSVASQ